MCVVNPLATGHFLGVIFFLVIFVSTKNKNNSQKIIFHQKKQTFFLVKNYFWGFFKIVGENKHYNFLFELAGTPVVGSKGVNPLHSKGFCQQIC